MANDPYWNKTRFLVHADDAVDPYPGNILYAATCNIQDIAEVGTLAKGSLTRFYNNVLGAKGAYYMYTEGSGAMWLDARPAASNPLASNYTVEAWVYITAYGDTTNYTTNYILATYNNNVYSNELTLGIELSTNGYAKWQLTVRNTGLSGSVFDRATKLNRWMHIAIVRTGNNTYFYQDGSLMLTNTTTNATVAHTAVRFGYHTNMSNRSNTQYVRDVRIYNYVKYTAGFSPADPLPYPLPLRDVLTNRSFAATGSALNVYTADYKFGGGCTSFDGASHVTSAASSDFNFGTDDFTVEAFVKVEAAPASGMYGQIFGIWANAWDNGWGFALSDSLTPHFWYRTPTTDYGLFASAPINLNTWYHFAVSRQGPNLYLFIDGTLVASRSDIAGQTVGNSATPIFFGRRSNSAADWFTGLIDETRITKGVARYTGAFTPPTSAHPEAQSVVSGTVRDHTGALCSRLVRVHSRYTGRVIGEAWSDPTTGAFSIGAAEECYAVVLDSTGSYNSLILDRLEPLL